MIKFQTSSAKNLWRLIQRDVHQGNLANWALLGLDSLMFRSPARGGGSHSVRAHWEESNAKELLLLQRSPSSEKSPRESFDLQRQLALDICERHADCVSRMSVMVVNGGVGASGSMPIGTEAALTYEHVMGDCG